MVSLKSLVAATLSRGEFGDLPLLLYFAAFIRQYFWIVDNNYLAWTLTALLSFAVWILFIRARDDDRDGLHPSFWPVVFLPIAFICCIRVAYPDTSYDVLNYHIFHSERALRGVLHIPGEIFPGMFPTFDPAADMITGISRSLLGYRLGVLINLAAMLWAGTIIDRILRLYIANAWLRSLAVLACLTAEHLLAEINNYMIDLLVLPLLLEATWMIICPSSDGKTVGLKEVVRFFLLMGMSVGLKLTNLTFAGPLCLLFAYSWISTEPASPRPPISKSLVAATAAFAAPIIPWTFYLWYRTGSPIFPLYNEIFRSPHWQLVNFFDGRWGPKGVIETLLWPLAVVFTPERLSELNFYSGRMLLGWVVALSSLVFVRKDPALKAMCGLTLGCGFLWSVSTGYIRYGLYLELLAGILTVACLAILIKSTDVRWQQSVRYAVAGVVLIALVTQCYFAAAWSFDHEWGGRPNCIRQRGCKNEFVQFFSDRTISQYETDEEYQLFANIDVWVETAPKTSAMMVMLRSDIPGLTYFPAFYEAPASRSSVAASLERLRGKRFFSLVVDDESGKSDSAKTLKMLGFTVKKVTSVKIPYFSRENTIPMLLIELQPPPNNELP